MTQATREADEVVFTIAYDGPSVARGRMPLLELAPAMLSTARLVEDGVRLIHGSTTALKIEVNADFQRGSFAYDIYTTVGSAGELLSNLSIEDIDRLLGWLGLTGGGGVLGLILWLRNRRVKSVEPVVDGARITVTDGTHTIVHAQVANLTFNQSIREHASGMLQPLKAQGITEFRSGRDGRPTDTLIEESQVEYFEPPPPPEQELQDRVTTEVIEVVAPSFRDGNKWRFAQGDSPFHAAVLDRDFLDAVNRHEHTFGKGDAFRVEMRLRVTQGPSGLTALREVVRVIEKIPPHEQFEAFGNAGEHADGERSDV